MLPEAAGRGQHFQVRGHSFSLYGPTLSREITYLFFSKLSNEKKLTEKKTHASVTGTVVRDPDRAGPDCRIRYRARLEKNKSIYFCVTNRRKSETSIKTGTRRITRLDDMLFEVRLERRITKSSSSRRVTRLVPVFILEMGNRTNYKIIWLYQLS